MTGDDSEGVRVCDRTGAGARDRVEEVAAEFEAAGRPYARATVVRREAPVSANVGDSALVTADGDLVGWVGGAECAQSVVLDRAMEALTDGDPVLVGLAPDPEEVNRPGVEAYPMTCHSGGTLEVFIEPVTPVPRLVVVGESPIASALAHLADEMGYGTAVVTAPDSSGPGAATDTTGETVGATDADGVADAIDGAESVVVASMGEFDELGVAAGLLTGASYIGLVASDERRDELASAVADRHGLDERAVREAVTTPAGIDIGAQTPEEIAVSILAELIGRRRGVEGPIAIETADASGAVETTAASEEADPVPAVADAETASEHDHAGDTETAVDPVCGMEVAVDEAAATVEASDETYHFCGQGCADAFEADPDRYREVATSG